MKRYLLSLVVTGILGSVLMGASALAHDTSNAKAVELSLHRIERLVILRKIEASYQTQFKTLTLQKLTPTQPTDPTYQIAAYQYAGADGSQKTLTLALDDDGKELSHATNMAMDAINAAVWPTADAVTIVENSLHWLEDQIATPELDEFNDGVTQLALSPATDGGTAIAYVDLQIAPGGKTLRIKMKTDATFLASEIIP